MVNYEKVKVHLELMARIGKGMATNGMDLKLNLN
jgi:hypothetical protein